MNDLVDLVLASQQRLRERSKSKVGNFDALIDRQAKAAKAKKGARGKAIMAFVPKTQQASNEEKRISRRMP